MLDCSASFRERIEFSVSFSVRDVNCGEAPSEIGLNCWVARERERRRRRESMIKIFGLFSEHRERAYMVALQAFGR